MSDHELLHPPDRLVDLGTRDPRWRGVRSDTIEIAGVPIGLLRADPATTAGVDGSADHAPVLLVHGLGGAATNWLDVLAPLADRVGREVVAVDLPGFGRSEPPTSRAARMVPQVHFLARLLDALGWDRAEIHGNSMGGLLTTVLAGNHPDRVARLVLVSPALPPPPPTDGRGPATLDAEVLARFTPFLLSWRTGRRVLRAYYTRNTPDEVFAATERLVLGAADGMREPMRQVGIEQAAASGRHQWRIDALARATEDLVRLYLTRRRWVYDALAEVRAPMLVLWGTADRLVARGVVDDLVRRRPDATRVDLVDVGHVAMIEAPDRYLDLLDQWRARVGSTSTIGSP